MVKTMPERNDFAPPRNLEELIFRLETYAAEIANMREWIGEQFGNPLNQKVISALEKARLGLEKLIKAVSK